MFDNGRKMWIQNNKEKTFIISNNKSEQIMKQTHRIHVCLIIFFNSLFSVSGKNPPEKKSSVRGQG